jgi:hypothetical protein
MLQFAKVTPKINRSLTIIAVMKAQLYGQNVPMWKSNQLWRAARLKHIQKDIQSTQFMTDSIFGGQFQATYQQNAMVLKIATQRALKKA